MFKRKLHKDFEVCAVNQSLILTEVNLWDSIMKHERKSLHDSFILGSLRIYSSNEYFFHSNEIELGYKTFLLSHYLLEGSNREAAIYDFSIGWLSPLKIPMSLSKPLKIKIPASSQVRFSFSVV